VFLSNGDTATNLTQFAYGRFMPGEVCEEHVHPTMEEYFYFLQGTGTYTVDGNTYTLEPGVFLRIPAGVPHMLQAGGNESLEFVYFGVATI
jgi:quercetin dioxygenase-like cupin family protein